MRKGFKAGDRHGWLNKVCRLIELVDQGREAEIVTLQIETIPSHETPRSKVVLLPIWQWVTPAKATAGRKGRSADGGSLLLPLRIRWTTPTVVVIPCDTSVTLKWCGSGYGQTMHGDVTVQAPGTVSSNDADIELTISRAIPKKTPLLAELKRISAAGQAAWWELLQLIEPWVIRSLDIAHHQVTQEFTNDSRTVVVSPTSIEAIGTHMLYGSTESPGSVERMLNAALQQNFTSVDPMRYMKTWIRRDAEEAIRRDIDDPKQGAKIRRLADAIGRTDVDALMSEYQRIYPADEIGMGRIKRALSLCPDPMAERQSLDEVQHPEGMSGGVSVSTPSWL